MIDRDKIKNVIVQQNFLSTTNFSGLGTKITGKVRDIYDLGEKMAFISTDRQSAFDRMVTLVPFKGQVLSQASCFWFDQTKDIVQNHFLGSPDPNVVIGKKLKIIPIEFVVRGYMTGSTQTSIWTAYSAGEREYCGHNLPEGLKKNQKFENALVTPTTKSEVDEKISGEEIVEKKIMSLQQWENCQSISLALFARGQSIALRQGFILVDTKYEFGLDENDNIVLADEIHTPDSSRFWIAKSYKECFENNKEPENIDKEFLRRWIKERCNPYQVEHFPKIPNDFMEELSVRYISLYEKTTGQDFIYRDENVMQQLEKNLQKYIIEEVL